MKVNTKVRYGLRAMIEIALSGRQGIFQKDIAKNQQLSDKYLDHIIASLKASGLIINVSGKKSGYVLAKPGSDITIYDIYRTFEPELSIIHCTNKPVTCFISRICVANEFWFGMNEMMTNYMKCTTLDYMVNKHLDIKKFIDKEDSEKAYCQ
jgi:Rrf2 family protein